MTENKKQCCFIGHRQVLAKDIEDKLTAAIISEIESGCSSFIVGTHGEFDELALKVCRRLRDTERGDIRIQVAITSLNRINKRGALYAPYCDVDTVMYAIEDAHYKRQITVSNMQMIDNCDRIICYVNTAAYRSGAKTALRYAQKQGLKIVNLYREQDQPLYGMTMEQIKELYN